MSRRARGLFVTFEGLEGSGKTTQVRRLAGRLRRLGVADVVVTREPGGTPFGRRLRRLLLSSSGTPPAPHAELLLYVADRAQHLAEIVLPALARGAAVLCDRYADATFAYQGAGRRLGVDTVAELHGRPPLDLRPHRTILLDLDPAAALARARRRNARGGRPAKQDRFERERLSFHRRVRQGYLELARAEPERIRIVDARGEPADVARRVALALADLWPALRRATR